MKNSKYKKLFKKGHIGDLEIKNRAIRMTMITGLSNTDCSVSDRQIKAFAEAAKGGPGIVFVDSALPVKMKHGGVSAASDEYISGLNLLADAIKQHGAVAGLQIAHPGRDAAFVGGDNLVAPSRVQWEPWYEAGAPVPRELSIEEIHELVGAFGDAARRAQIAGFDIVEIHAASGTLPCNFLSPLNNRRNDMYGGSLKNRMRFLIEIIKDVKKKTGPGFPVSVRLSSDDNEPGGIKVEETIEVAKACEAAGVDAINVTGGSHGEAVRTGSMLLPMGINVDDAAEIKKHVNVPVMVGGGFQTPEFAEKVLAEGKADFIGLGKPLLADPFWVKKAKEGRSEDIKPCIRCIIGCHDRGFLAGRVVHCAVNPTLYKYESPEIVPAEHPKNVAIIGGGPAGLEAAIVSTKHGHNVTLFEKREIGGVMIEAAVPDYKSDIARLIKYYKTQLEKLNIKVIREEATIDTIKNGNFDAAIVAVGGKTRKLDVPGIDNEIVSYAMDVLGNKVEVGNKVVIIGAGITGVETADILAEQGKDVTIVDMQDQLLESAGSIAIAYLQRIQQAGIKVITGKRLESVKNHTAVLVDRFGNRQDFEADSIVISAGFAPQRSLQEQIENETDVEVFSVGNCKGERHIYDAIHEGFIAARCL